MKLWIPGPTAVRPEILAELSRPMIGHRSAACGELIERLDPHLALAFGLPAGSESRVAVHTTSATGMMEGALAGVGPRVLSVVGGAFGKRWAEIGEALGKELRRLEVPWGSSVDPDELARALDEHGPFDALTLVVNETSTGVRTPLAPIARVLAGRDTLLLTDVVSYLAGGPVDFDEHGLDFALAGSQKALALPPGLTVFCASARYLERAAAVAARGYYLDPVRVIDGHRSRKTPSTPALSLYYALARQLEDISAGLTLPERERGLEGAAAWRARFDVHERMRAATAAWAAGHGLEPLPAPEHASPTISCLRAGELDVRALIAGLKERGHEIGNGYGELKDVTFRIGHMGDHTEAGLAELLALADEVLG